MAGFSLSIFTLIWAILIICVIVSGVWVFFAIRKSFGVVLVFDILFQLMLECLCLRALVNPANIGDLPFYLITLVTFMMNTALTAVILLEWRDTPHRMSTIVWWFKIALSIAGIFTVIPLGLYFLKLYYLPVREARQIEQFRISSSLPESGHSLPEELATRYRNWEFLGQGGFAQVFRATRQDGTKVAIKIPRELTMATGMNFIAEIQNWTRLTHENIVRVYTFNVLPIPFLELELCDGSLALTKKPLDPITAALKVHEICRGLAYSHDRGIVHRDLKPSNILIRDGICKVSDWGLCKALCESGDLSMQLACTVPYAAPEQIRGFGTDKRTDTWQVGVIFYELITGEIPFKGQDQVAQLACIATRNPIPPSDINSSAAGVEPIILRCLEKDPTARWQNSGELCRAIATYLRDELTQRMDASIATKDDRGAAYYASKLLVLALEEESLQVGYRVAGELINFLPWYQQGPIRKMMKAMQDSMQSGANGSRPNILEFLEQARGLRNDLSDGRDEA